MMLFLRKKAFCHRFILFFLHILVGLMACLFASSGHAWQWRDLWATPDQQAQVLMEKQQFKQAQHQFERDDWQAAAAYRAKDYKKSAELYGLQHDDYNQGNALAQAGHYQQAIRAYTKAMKRDPTNQDAAYNRHLLENWLKNKKEKLSSKQNQKKQGQDKQSQDKQSQDKQSQDKQGQDKQGQDKQGQDKQGQDKQGQDKQAQDKQGQDKQGQDKQGQDKQGQDKQGQDKQSYDKKGQEQPSHGYPSQQTTEASREEKQAKEQWLRLIPDNPGGLLREKFLRDHRRRARG